MNMFERLDHTLAVVDAIPTAFEAISVDNSAGGKKLTSSAYDGLTMAARITVESNPIRIRVDGGAPDMSTGHIINVGDIIELVSEEELTNFSAITMSDTATAKLMVTYYKLKGS